MFYNILLFTISIPTKDANMTDNVVGVKNVGKENAKSMKKQL